MRRVLYVTILYLATENYTTMPCLEPRFYPEFSYSQYDILLLMNSYKLKKYSSIDTQPLSCRSATDLLCSSNFPSIRIWDPIRHFPC
jgi:hypothetical protein